VMFDVEVNHKRISALFMKYCLNGNSCSYVNNVKHRVTCI
jgi:hypothetical protein